MDVSSDTGSEPLGDGGHRLTAAGAKGQLGLESSLVCDIMTGAFPLQSPCKDKVGRWSFSPPTKPFELKKIPKEQTTMHMQSGDEREKRSPVNQARGMDIHKEALRLTIDLVSSKVMW
jgi:hypothetical protein